MKTCGCVSLEEAQTLGTSMRNKRDVVLLLSVAFFSTSCIFTLNVLVGGFAEELAAGDALVGLIGSVASLSALASRSFTGRITDVLAKRKVETLGLLCMFATCAICVLARNPFVLLVARIVQGVGFACCSSCVGAWLAALVPRECLGKVMAAYGTVIALSMAVTPSLGVGLLAVLPSRVILGMLCIMPLCSLTLLRFVRDDGVAIPQGPDQGEGIILGGALHKAALPVAYIMVLLSMPYFATQVFLVQYVAAKGSALLAGLFFPAYSVSLMIMRLLLARVAGRIRYRDYLLVCAVCQIATMLILNDLHDHVGLVLSAVSLAMGYGVLTIVSQTAALLSVHPSQSGSANSTYFAGTDFGTAAGALLGGIVLQLWGFDAFYPCFMIVVPLALLIYLVYRKRLAIFV